MSAFSRQVKPIHLHRNGLVKFYMIGILDTSACIGWVHLTNQGG